MRSRLGVLLMIEGGLLVAAAVFWLGYANGANDNFKGVATLFGTGTTDYPRALRWATAATFLGSLTSMVIGAALARAFSGKGLVPDALVADPRFLAAVGLGAAGTVLAATRFGLPISTTHALLGALIGAGFAAQGVAGINFSGLGTQFILPLLASPLAALGLTALLYPLFHRTRRALGVSRETCLCVGEEVRVVAAEFPGRAAVAANRFPVVIVGTNDACFDRYAGTLVGVSAQAVLDRLHYLSAGAVSFARGLNDTPKVVALLITARAFDVPVGFGLAAMAIALGGFLSARRVAETMSYRITAMNHGQGLTANLVTSLLVIVASRWGMPVSTTHVSCGSLFGIGAVTGQARWASIGGIVLAWVTTLPIAACLAAGLFLIGH